MSDAANDFLLDPVMAALRELDGYVSGMRALLVAADACRALTEEFADCDPRVMIEGDDVQTLDRFVCPHCPDGDASPPHSDVCLWVRTRLALGMPRNPPPHVQLTARVKP